MNVRDSQWLTAALQEKGLVSAGIEDADIIIMNTCSVRAKPEQKILQNISQLRAAKKGSIRFVILGCVAQQLGKSLLEENEDVILVAGGDNLHLVPEMLLECLAGAYPRNALLEFNAEYCEKPIVCENPVNNSAYITIMQGCDNFCSYCIVPFTRGRPKSRALDNILEECRRMLNAGARQIVLLGQNVNAWGKDLPGDTNFAALLHRVASLPGLERLRFLTSHPRDFSCDIIEAIRDMPVICPDLHLPLQAGSSRILSRMKRRYDAREYLELVHRLYKARPDLALRTDLIVGFPGETDSDFEQTLEMVKKCRFVSSYSFCYSDRPGTLATVMGQKIPRNIMLARLKQLQGLQDALTARWLESKIGKEVEVLIEQPSRRSGLTWWCGRDRQGDMVNMELDNGNDYTGQVIHARITDAKKYTLVASAMRKVSCPTGGTSTNI